MPTTRKKRSAPSGPDAHNRSASPDLTPAEKRARTIAKKKERAAAGAGDGPRNTNGSAPAVSRVSGRKKVAAPAARKGAGAAGPYEPDNGVTLEGAEAAALSATQDDSAARATGAPERPDEDDDTGAWEVLSPARTGYVEVSDDEAADASEEEDYIPDKEEVWVEQSEDEGGAGSRLDRQFKAGVPQWEDSDGTSLPALSARERQLEALADADAPDFDFLSAPIPTRTPSQAKANRSKESTGKGRGQKQPRPKVATSSPATQFGGREHRPGRLTAHPGTPQPRDEARKQGGRTGPAAPNDGPPTTQVGRASEDRERGRPRGAHDTTPVARDDWTGATASNEEPPATQVGRASEDRERGRSRGAHDTIPGARNDWMGATASNEEPPATQVGRPSEERERGRAHHSTPRARNAWPASTDTKRVSGSRMALGDQPSDVREVISAAAADEVPYTIAFEHGYPDEERRFVLLRDGLIRAAEGLNKPDIVARLKVDEHYGRSMMKIPEARVSNYRKKFKEGADDMVQYMYRLEQFPEVRYVQRMKRILEPTAPLYIFPGTFETAKMEVHSGSPYCHPAIPYLIHEVCFGPRAKPRFPRAYYVEIATKKDRPELPRPMVAMAATAIEAGLRAFALEPTCASKIDFVGDIFGKVYEFHSVALRRLKRKKPAAYSVLMAQLYEAASKGRGGTKDRDTDAEDAGGSSSDSSDGFIDVDGFEKTFGGQ
ncbi:hypothetical protein FA95DRAFT_1577685 [Auriscalpium vulgare]|uniref:Uncharacterized protein n=1 Tax=Auriscalpium vulgare TaxID=40419 RepID=A0ACB8R5Z7_9AGAM|nr:hypothetical protein FA95DRAFT_1577685 [Auriscalpium vulgare]